MKIIGLPTCFTAISHLFYSNFPSVLQQFQQHDVQELNRILFTAIESSLVGTSGKDIINKLYHGRLANKVRLHYL